MPARSLRCAPFFFRTENTYTNKDNSFLRNQNVIAWDQKKSVGHFFCRRRCGFVNTTSEILYDTKM